MRSASSWAAASASDVMGRVPVTLLCAGLLGCASAALPSGALDVVDLEGRHRALFVGRDQVTVLLFVAVDCPIANSYAPEIAALVRDHAALPVEFLLVHVDPAIEVEALREHARRFALPGPLVLDRDHALVRRAGATVTPEAVVLDRAGRIAYRGRIDDSWSDLGRRRTVVRQQDLRDALAAVVSGRAVPRPWPEALGCSLP